MRPTNPFILLVLSLALPAGAHAQFGAFVRKLLVGDTAAPPQYDTAYITSYKQNLNLSAVGSYRLASMTLSDTLGREATWSTNNVTQYGFAIDFKWLTAEATFSVPFLEEPDPTYGATKSKGFGLGYTGRRIWFRGFWNTSSGFYVEQPEVITESWTASDAWPHRSDLEAETWMGSLNYALSRKQRFSQVAALSQMERQKRSAGTWVAGLAFWLTRISADSSLVPTTGPVAFPEEARIIKARRTLFGATMGYTHTFVFWQKAFINFAFLFGAASSDQVRTVEGYEEQPAEKGLSALMEMKLGAGYNGDRWYFGITNAFYFNEDADERLVSLGAMYGTTRLAAGVRLGRPNIKGIDKVGL